MKQNARKRRREQQHQHGGGAQPNNPQQLKKKHAETRRNLPVFKYKSELCRMVAKNEVVLVIAETVRFKRCFFDFFFFFEN